MTPVGKTLRRTVDEARIEAGWENVRARRSRPRVLRRAAKVAPVVVLVAALVLVVRAWIGVPGPVATPMAASTAVSPTVVVAPLALADGAALPPVIAADESTALVPLADGSRLEIGEHTRLTPKAGPAERVELSLERGKTTFDVKPGGPRMWVVDAGPVIVRVLGTRFTVARDGEAVRVMVERGKVQVEGGGATTILVAGQEWKNHATPASTPVVTKPQDPRPAPAVRDAMDRADELRRTGRAREAVSVLRGIVDSGDARAPLAAFTLGKIHAEDLGDAGSAARWFERALALGLPAGLDEEACARAVESWSRAGARAEATRARERYETRFPGGRHLARVRTWAEPAARD